jgi:hypothetical protein
MYSSNVIKKLIFCILAGILSYPLSGFAVDWDKLNGYIGQRTLEQLRDDFAVLQQKDAAAAEHIAGHIVFTETEIRVVGDAGTTEYIFPIQPVQVKAKRESREGELLVGVSIALDGNNLSHVDSGYPAKTQAITRELAVRLEAAGARVRMIPFFGAAMSRAHYPQIVAEINGFNPDITVAIRFKSGGEQPHGTFLSFCPGCFMTGEVATVDQRFRFMHALVTGKVEESKKLAMHFAAQIRTLGHGQLHDPRKHGVFGGNACEVPVGLQLEKCRELGVLDDSALAGPAAAVLGVLARNLFINGVTPTAADHGSMMRDVLSPAVVWVNPGHSFFVEVSVPVLAEHYFQAILSYVTGDRD